mmetsp:Transcript_14253/g.16201  ORF Transcript_14253/g.16201 Transcript_14253/m.16201 type:complete len:419 (-) Transcript_14253:366-1622(-)
MATANGSASVEEKAAVLVFLPKAGKLPEGIDWKFPCLLQRKDNDSDSDEEADGSDLKGAPPLKSVRFDKCPKFSVNDFFVVSPEESHRDQDIFFSKEQDHSLVRAVQAYGTGQWNHIHRLNPMLKTISKSLLMKRWEMLNLELDDDEEIAMKTDADGNSIIGTSNLGDLMVLESGSVGSANEDNCHICGLLGELLCCDSCPSAYHLSCLGLDALPEDDIWNCPECKEKANDIIDDTELKDDDWQQYTETFGSIGTALQIAATGKAKNTVGEDGTITQALIGVVQSNDSNFERITAEIEATRGFQSQSLMEAENKLLADFAEKEKETAKDEESKEQNEADDVSLEDDDEEDEDIEEDIMDIIDDEEEELEDTKMDVDVIDTSIRVQESAALPEKRSGIGTKSLASNAAVNILQPRKKQK